VEHWYRYWTQIENLFRDTKLGTALRHLPSGYQQVNRAWMWGALLGASIIGWLHQLTATTGADGRLHGQGVRGGQAMIATLQHRLLHVLARLVHHAGRRSCACHPNTSSSPRSWPASAPCLHRPDHAEPRRTTPNTARPSIGNRPPAATCGPATCTQPDNPPEKINTAEPRSAHALLAGFGSEAWGARTGALSRTAAATVAERRRAAVRRRAGAGQLP
jgi:hypothetical protein